MKGFICAVIIIAGLFCWGWFNLQRSNELTEQNTELRRKLKEFENDFEHEQSNTKKTVEQLRIAELQLNKIRNDYGITAVNQTPDEKSIQSAPSASAENVKKTGELVEKTEPASPKTVSPEVVALKQQSQMLEKRKTELERTIKLTKNKLMNGGISKSTTGWYYINKDGTRSGIYSMSTIGSRNIKRRIGYVSESKESVKASEAEKYETELASVISQKSAIDAKIAGRE